MPVPLLPRATLRHGRRDVNVLVAFVISTSECRLEIVHQSFLLVGMLTMCKAVGMTTHRKGRRRGAAHCQKRPGMATKTKN